MVIVLVGSLWTPFVQASPEYEEQHPHYQNLLDTLNASESYYFEKYSYARSGSSAIALTHVYQLLPDARKDHLLTLEHVISYLGPGVRGISTGALENQHSTKIITTVDAKSLPDSARMAIKNAFGKELPVRLKSTFQAQTVEHHLEVSGWFLEKDGNSFSSEGFDAGFVAQASGALAVYAGLEKSSVIMLDEVSFQLDQLLLALNIMPLPDSAIPLIEFNARIPGAVTIGVPIGGFPLTGSIRGLDFTTGIRYNERTYELGFSASAEDVVIPFMPLKGTDFAFSLDGVTEQAKQSLEELYSKTYADGTVSGNEQAAWINLLRNELLSPGLGMTLKSSFDSFMGEANILVSVEIDNESGKPPAMWQTRRDLLENVSAQFFVNADRTLFNLIPESELPDQEILDRVITIDGSKVRSDIRLENGVLWINEEPMSLSLLLGSEIDEPLWPASVTQKHNNLFGEFFENQDDESSPTTELPDHIAGPTQEPDVDTQASLAQLQQQKNALQAELALLQMELQSHKSVESDVIDSDQHKKERAQEQAQAQAQEQAQAHRAQRPSTVLSESTVALNYRTPGVVAEERLATEELEREAAIKAEITRDARIRQRRLAQMRKRYFTAIRQRVERNWRRPSGTYGNVNCTVSIVQSAAGEVLQVSDVDCNGNNPRLQSSISNAVIASSPLPVAPDRRLFDRRVKFYFNPG